MDHIQFSRAPVTGSELSAIEDVVRCGHFAVPFIRAGKRCQLSIFLWR